MKDIIMVNFERTLQMLQRAIDDYTKDVEILGLKASLADRILDQIRHVQHDVGSMHTQLRRALGAPLSGLVWLSELWRKLGP